MTKKEKDRRQKHKLLQDKVAKKMTKIVKQHIAKRKKKWFDNQNMCNNTQQSQSCDVN